MLDINWIRANAAAVDAALQQRKNVPFSASELIALDDARKAIITRLEDAQAARNAFSKQIGQAKAQKDEARAAELLEQVAHLKDAIQADEAARREALFQQSIEAERTRGDALSRRFEEALKQAREEPVTKPMRDFDWE